jgi:hypothetical protein
VHALELGTTAADTPLLIVVGGVHGIERIGTEVVLAFFAALLGRLGWDRTTRDALERARLWILPVLNPVGLARGTRANGRGVDLMRNAPGDDVGRATPLVGGQRFARWLPWYRGGAGEAMEPEAAALVSWVADGIARAPAAIALDVHLAPWSIGQVLRPHPPAHAHLAELRALTGLLDASRLTTFIASSPRPGLHHPGDLDHVYAATRAGWAACLCPHLEMGRGCG